MCAHARENSDARAPHSRTPRGDAQLCFSTRPWWRGRPARIPGSWAGQRGARPESPPASPAHSARDYGTVVPETRGAESSAARGAAQRSACSLEDALDHGASRHSSSSDDAMPPSGLTSALGAALGWAGSAPFAAAAAAHARRLGSTRPFPGSVSSWTCRGPADRARLSPVTGTLAQKHGVLASQGVGHPCSPQTPSWRPHRTHPEVTSSWPPLIGAGTDAWPVKRRIRKASARAAGSLVSAQATVRRPLGA